MAGLFLAGWPAKKQISQPKAGRPASQPMEGRLASQLAKPKAGLKTATQPEARRPAFGWLTSWLAALRLAC